MERMRKSVAAFAIMVNIAQHSLETVLEQPTTKKKLKIPETCCTFISHYHTIPLGQEDY